jgi:hypothetical protein
VRRGRPRIYATPEEAKAAKKAQQRICQQAHRNRFSQALSALRELEGHSTLEEWSNVAATP